MRIWLYIAYNTNRWYADINGQQMPLEWLRGADWRVVRDSVQAEYPVSDVVVDILSR